VIRTVFIALVSLAMSTALACAADGKDEADFVTRASTANRMAIAESRLALDRAGDTKVQAFAHRLLDDHGAAETALEAAAEGSGAKIPTALDKDRQLRVTALQERSGADLDRAYVADQVEIHSNALTLYADYMLLGDNEKLKTLAIRMIPIAEAQLNEAQALSGD
jgi:putative membrane protein